MKKSQKSFAGQFKSTKADKNGKWMVELNPLKASKKGASMLIQGKNTIKLSDILVGEVWLASGQSNMEWTFSRIVKAEQEIALKQLENDHIRFFHVEKHLSSAIPLDDTLGRWKKCKKFLRDQQSVSAVAFFFASKLHKELDVPIAILDSNWGGQKIDCFISEYGYKKQKLPYKKYWHEANTEKRIEKFNKIKESVNRAVKAESLGMRVTYAEEKINGSASNYIYNAMIAPLTPYSIKGVIWYQGESNRGDHNYFEKLKALVEGWSKDFRVKNLPLLQVQIAPWDYTRGQKPKDHTLGDTIWKAQYKAAKELPRVGLIPIHDTNIDINDIHPQHKLQVGERLAALALNDHYSVKKYCRAPEFDKALITK